MRTRPTITLPVPRIVVRGEFGVDVAELVTRKLAPVARHAHVPLLDMHVRLTRHENLAGGRPVIVEVTLDVNGRQVRAEADAHGARDALDRVVDRLVRQLDSPPDPRRRRAGGRR
ncbi:MAG: hypothetical protein GEV28_15795 [Actinophytocola sp.]|uniref:HPF/RaiA family ribosome-associated protein n=1 Tax=Actinophytocola sp. TaxID=1872138 RepID=UPI001320F399|nr:HPF/RaiA family ribosome-associated protein [Actinophytocola sp.]MPZ81780.1 hypothetical protein [Actinophytocola sp.]